jgi:hypothetical protein
MPVLHLGVVDIPYVQYEPQRAQAKRAKGSKKAPKQKTAAGTQTTGDVAEWLENKYHVMEVFFQLHEKDIAETFENALAGALENIALGAPNTVDALASATSNVEDLFKKFLSLKEMDALGVAGVPTQASLDGVNHRLKSGKGPTRPSFIDTGLYEASFACWVEND